jgi:hypothetical protein
MNVLKTDLGRVLYKFFAETRGRITPFVTHTHKMADAAEK